MLRKQKHYLKKIDYCFNVENVVKEYKYFLNKEGLKDHHQKVTEKLAEGVNQYHTGGWKEIPLTIKINNKFYVREEAPFTKEIFDWFESETVRIKFSVLQKGHKINPHFGNVEKKEYCRIHIPIITDNYCPFFVEGKSFLLKEGEIWYLNNTKMHWVENNSLNIDRVHLILDLLPSPKIEMLFSNALKVLL